MFTPGCTIVSVNTYTFSRRYPGYILIQGILYHATDDNFCSCKMAIVQL